MNLDIKVVSFIIASILLFLHFLLYVSIDFYYIIKNPKIKKFINKLLPFLTRYNAIFLVSAFLLYCIFNYYNLSYSNYIKSIILIIIMTTFLLSLLLISSQKKEIIPKIYLRIFSYLLIISLILIPVLQ